MDQVLTIAGNSTYFVLAALALWGAWSAVMVWRRVAQMRFRSEDDQMEFLGHLEEPLLRGDFDTVAEYCEHDPRAIPRLIMLAVANRDIGFAKVRQLVLERFQQDVLADLENRLAWVNTVIKSAPMVGLLGTVLGMMGAFGKLTGDNVAPEQLANDIMLALITTACGLSIAIPLILSLTMINVRIRKLEDLVSLGVTRFMEAYRAALS